MLLQTAQATNKYLDVLKLKKNCTFRFCSFTMLQKRSLLKLTEHSELNTKITSKTWSFQARRQDSVTGGEGQKRILGGRRKFIYVNSRVAGGPRNLFQYGSNEQGEDQKQKRSLVQKFPQILVIVSKFVRFFTNS